jgi:PPOX class probable F420-dependent enzyme
MKVEPWARRLLIESSSAHLGTSTKDGTPHVVPICYVYDGNSIYSSIDEKPKRTSPDRLRRVRNIIENSSVSLVVDKYGEDWSKLRYVIVPGIAQILHEGDEHKRAISLLRKKYHQYRSMKLENRPIVKIRPVSVIAWSATGT